MLLNLNLDIRQNGIRVFVIVSIDFKFKLNRQVAKKYILVLGEKFEPFTILKRLV